jgi:hypothetical protein
LDFSLALMQLKKGRRICRLGWNGRGMWLVLVQPRADFILSGTPALEGCRIEVDRLAGEPYLPSVIAMRTAEGKLQLGWLASQADLLADDWEVVGG